MLKEFLLTAEQGDPDSQYKLGIMHLYNHKVPKNYRKAAKWLRKAAEQGHSSAQGSLGSMYYEGKGVLKNYQEAAKWLRREQIPKCEEK